MRLPALGDGEELKLLIAVSDLGGLLKPSENHMFLNYDPLETICS